MDVDKLIHAVKGQPCLWDTQNKSYKDHPVKEKAWKDVVSEVGGAANVEQCSKKWKNLRDQFARELKKKKKNPTYESHWQHYELMQFVSGEICHRVQGCRRTEWEEEDDDDDLELVDTEYGSTPPTSSRSFSPWFMSPQLQVGRKRHRPSSDDELEIHSKCANWVKVMTEEKVQKSLAENKASETFGLHITEKLCEMTPRQRAIAQVKIQQVLLEVEFPDKPHTYCPQERTLQFSQPRQTYNHPQHQCNHGLPLPQPSIMPSQQQPLPRFQEHSLSSSTPTYTSSLPSTVQETFMQPPIPFPNSVGFGQYNENSYTT